jgi:hypothetical protein
MNDSRSGRGPVWQQKLEPKHNGKDDATGWTHGGPDTLRDVEGGTYGALPGAPRPEQVKEPRPTGDPQQGADVRHEAEPLLTTLPAGLTHRTRPMNKTSGRRSADKASRVHNHRDDNRKPQV